MLLFLLLNVFVESKENEQLLPERVEFFKHRPAVVQLARLNLHSRQSRRNLHLQGFTHRQLCLEAVAQQHNS